MTDEQFRKDIRTAEVLYQGREAYRRAKGPDEPVSLRRVAWFLFQEAVQTQKAIRAPGHTPIRSGMPEPYMTPAEIFATEVEMTRDKITYPTVYKPNASGAQIDRYVEVMSWLRFIRGRNIPRTKRAFLALAAGYRQQRVRAAFGYETDKAVEAMRYFCLTCIARKLAKVVPEDFSGSQGC